MSSTTANSAEKVKKGEGSDSVHGFGYCFRDKRHVPAATTQPGYRGDVSTDHQGTHFALNPAALNLRFGDWMLV